MRLWLGVGLVAVASATLGVAVGGAASTLPDGVRVDSSPSTLAASGSCSKTAATSVVKRLGLRDVSPTYPVYKVLCGAFTGPESRVMVASISGPDNVGMLYWAVFRWSGSDWQLLFKRRQAAVLTAAGPDIKETVSIYRPNDSRCCPSGGMSVRIWHWNGSRFVAGPSKQGTKGEPEPRGFDSPSLNINCGMFDQSGGRYVRCQSRVPPQKVVMDASSRLTICRDRTPNVDNDCNLGDRGEGPIQPLAYGKQITVGRFRCQSLEIGVRCTVIQSGNGFLINRDGVTRVGS